jgi:hypothetical protein
MAFQSPSTVRSAAFRRRALSFAKAFSIGLKSGLYGGRAPAASIALWTDYTGFTARPEGEAVPLYGDEERVTPPNGEADASLGPLTLCESLLHRRPQRAGQSGNGGSPSQMGSRLVRP